MIFMFSACPVNRLSSLCVINGVRFWTNEIIKARKGHGSSCELGSLQNSCELSVKIQVTWKKLVLQRLEKSAVFLD